MGSKVTRFQIKKTAFAGRDVKRTEVRHARTEVKGRPARPMRPMRAR